VIVVLNPTSCFFISIISFYFTSNLFLRSTISSCLLRRACLLDWSRGESDLYFSSRDILELKSSTGSVTSVSSKCLYLSAEALEPFNLVDLLFSSLFWRSTCDSNYLMVSAYFLTFFSMVSNLSIISPLINFLSIGYSCLTPLILDDWGL